MPRLAAFAQEFEGLVALGARQGWLNLGQLVGVYAQLHPSTHPELDNPRKIDIEAVLRALRTLPLEIIGSDRLRVVPDLQAYPHTPIARPGGMPAGIVSDGNVILEAPLGWVSIVSLSTALCVLQHEVNKAALLTPDEEWSEDLDGGDSDDDAQNDRAAAIARLAFGWGTDPASLELANRQTAGGIMRLLLGHEGLPDVDIHADLDPGAIEARHRRQAERIVATLAEMGLLSRPLHLWVGDSVVSNCLSPYPRDLRDVLWRWAQMQPEFLGEDMAGSAIGDVDGEVVSYALAYDFVATDDNLGDERSRADRTVGLQRYRFEDVDFEAIDLARVDLSHCDPRVDRWEPAQPASVLLRIPLQAGDPNAGLLRYLLEALGESIASITLVLEGSVFNGPPGTIILPHLMVTWGGEHKLSLPATQAFEQRDFHGYADHLVQRGAVLSVPSSTLISAPHVAQLQREYNVAALEVGGAGLLRAIHDALWSGRLDAGTRVGWVLVATQRVSNGRPSVDSLAGLSAVAIATLRDLGAPIDSAPEPVQETAPKPEQPLRPSPRAIRIKA